MHSTNRTGEYESCNQFGKSTNDSKTQDPSCVSVRGIFVVGYNVEDPAAAFQEVKTSIIKAMLPASDVPLRIETKSWGHPQGRLNLEAGWLLIVLFGVLRLMSGSEV